MKAYKYFILAFFSITFLSLNLHGQKFKNRVGYIGNIGMASYNGELSPDFQSYTFKPSTGIGLVYRLNSLFSARSEINFFKLSGGIYTKNNSIAFKSNNIELNGVLIFDLLPQKKSFKSRSALVPYIFAGFGLVGFISKVQSSGLNSNFKINSKQNDVKTSAVIPMGLGLKIKTSEFLDIMLEVGYRQTFSKNLDNISPNTQYVEPATMNSEITTTPIPTNTSSTLNDKYILTNVKVIFTPTHLFKKKIKSSTPPSKAVAKRQKSLSRQIAKNKKIASDKTNRLADNR